MCQIQIKRHTELASSLFVLNSIKNLSNYILLRDDEAASV